MLRPGSGLGIAYTTDISTGKFTQTNWTAGVPGVGGVGPWMKALGDAQQEIKLEAGAHMVELDSGDLLHFYAAATPGWVVHEPSTRRTSQVATSRGLFEEAEVVEDHIPPPLISLLTYQYPPVDRYR